MFRRSQGCYDAEIKRLKDKIEELKKELATYEKIAEGKVEYHNPLWDNAYLVILNKDCCEDIVDILNKYDGKEIEILVREEK